MTWALDRDDFGGGGDIWDMIIGKCLPWLVWDKSSEVKWIRLICSTATTKGEKGCLCCVLLKKKAP